MNPWVLLDCAAVPNDAGEMCLYRRGDEFSIRVDGYELMNSRAHASEDELGRLTCERIAGRSAASVLVGGLGMGFTLAAVLAGLGADGRVVVAELMPAVVRWNREQFPALAGQPLEDPRVKLRVVDVAGILAAETSAYDAVILDVDNGPEALSAKSNAWLYGASGLRKALAALRPGGLLAVWSLSSDPAFVRRLKRLGFAVEEVALRGREAKRGTRSLIWIATAPGR